jgi:PhnB protein
MTSVKPIPDGYRTVTPYILVENAEKLMEFLQKAFDASEIKGFSMADGTVAHSEVRLGDSVIMLAEAKGDEYRPTLSGIHLYVEDCDVVYKRALEAGAVSIMQPMDQLYGDRSAAVKDQFGNYWWIATHIEDLPKEEITRRMNALKK